MARGFTDLFVWGGRSFSSISTTLLVVVISIAVTFRAYGQPQSGLFYYAVENLDRGRIEQRGTSDNSGSIFNNLILASQTRYRLWLLRAEDLEVGHVVVETAGPGTRLEIPAITIRETSAPDTDGDGLHDLGENILGTLIDIGDTDDDGVSDAAEVRQGTDPNVNNDDPSAGAPAQTGIIASADTPGTAVDVCAVDDVVVVADSDGGVTVFNVFNGLNPRAIARVPTPQAEQVRCANSLVAVADHSFGLLVIDIADPPAADILHRVDLLALGGQAIVG